MQQARRREARTGPFTERAETRLCASTGPRTAEIAENQWKIQKRLRPGSLSDFTQIQAIGTVSQSYVSWATIL